MTATVTYGDLSKMERLLFHVVYFLYKLATLAKWEKSINEIPKEDFYPHLVRGYTSAQQKRELRVILAVIGGGLSVHSVWTIIIGGGLLSIFSLVFFDFLDYQQPMFLTHLYASLFIVIPFLSIGVGFVCKSAFFTKLKGTTTRDFPWILMLTLGVIGFLLMIWII